MTLHRKTPKFENDERYIRLREHLTHSQILRLNKDWTLGEIADGEMVDGEWIPKPKHYLVRN